MNDLLFNHIGWTYLYSFCFTGGIWTSDLKIPTILNNPGAIGDREGQGKALANCYMSNIAPISDLMIVIDVFSLLDNHSSI
jgi:hypothetical protein